MKPTVFCEIRWPPDRPRTPEAERREGPFQVDLIQATCELFEEIERLGGERIVLSIDVEMKYRNGLWVPRLRREPFDDPAAAVYFDLEGNGICLASDRYAHPQDNVRAIGLSVKATRALARYGVMETAKTFSGFRALPAAGEDWRAVFRIEGGRPDFSEVKKKYRQLAAAAHPDRGGNPHEMQRLNAAFEAAKAELNS